MPFPTAALVAALLVVTGPTVIGPMLRDIRPAGRVGAVAKWEGIIVDPIGVMLALVVYEGVSASEHENWTAILTTSGWAIFKTVFFGGFVGVASARVLTYMLRRFAIPDHLQNPVVLMFVAIAFSLANLIQEESGLLAVTLMGIVLANQREVSIKHIVEFKETLGVVLISSLFIILAARLPLTQLASIGWHEIAFVAFLIAIVRPVAVFVSTVASPLSGKERAFLAFLAPRGIVAAAVASVFELRLEDGEGQLVSTTFLVIVLTVSFYGLTAGPLARWLGLSGAAARGIFLVGANPVARAIARALEEAKITVRMVDTNYSNVAQARMEGLRCEKSDILATSAHEMIDLGGTGMLLAVTPNDEVNALSSAHYRDVYGRRGVYQLAPRKQQNVDLAPGTPTLGGRVAFGASATYQQLSDRLTRGATIKRTRLTDEFTFKDFMSQYGERALPLFTVTESGAVSVFTADRATTNVPSQCVLLSLLEPEPAPVQQEATVATA